MSKEKKKGSKVLIVLGLVIVIGAIIYAFTDFITDIIWFREVGYTSVFLTEIVTKLKLGIPTFVIVAVVSYIVLSMLKNNFLKKNGLSINSSKDHKRMRLVGIVLSIVLGAFLSYLVIYDLWFEILQFINSTEYGVTDPLFGNDISFYMFKYDFLSGLAGSAMVIIFGILVVVLIYYSILVILSKKQEEYFDENETVDTESTEEPKRDFNMNDPIGSIFNIAEDAFNGKKKSFVKNQGGLIAKVKAVLGLILAQVTTLAVLFFFALAAKLMFVQFGLLYGGEGVAYGAGYTDVVIRLNVYRILIVLSIVAGIMLIIAAKKRSFKYAVIVPVLMIAVAIVGTGASKLVQNLIVEPNELSKESKYIENNIEYTRLAYGLADIKAYDFEPDADLDKIDVLNNMETFSNIRINDFEPTEQFYNQTQSIRSYYKFNDVDVDRYYVNGEYTQCFLSAREIDETKVEDSWLIQHLKYTHGHGITLSRVDKVTSSGQPDMLIQSIPADSEVPEIQITRPEIYFGEKTENYVIVNTKEPEFDYPSGESNVYCEYEGEGGIPLNFINRVMFSIREKSFKLLVSTNINSDSRILVYRNIMDRVRKIAPFLTFDNDPYVVTVDGGIYWIVDAYTMSDKFPYSEPYYSDSSINYIRNSVKVVIDAYNGTVDFYICDENDPVVKTYAKIYPALFKSLDEMPEQFKTHLQYPNALFNIQASVYQKYHMTDVGTFYQNEDLWSIAHDIYGQTEATMTANYFIMKLPGEESAEFVSTIAYTPSGKANLTGLLTARSDGENYGQIVLYRMPKDRIIYGPAQIEAQINQDAEISKEFALWNNSGSTYSRGDMFVIPIENSLLYVEPVYLEASTSSLPEVKRVIVYYNDKLAYSSTLSEALDELFGEGSGDPLKTSYPIITGKEMAKELENNPGSVTPDNPGDEPVIIDPAPTPEQYEKEAITQLIKEITNKLNELQKYLEK